MIVPALLAAGELVLLGAKIGLVVGSATATTKVLNRATDAALNKYDRMRGRAVFEQNVRLRVVLNQDGTCRVVGAEAA